MVMNYALNAPGIRPIRERFLSTSMYFGLIFDEGLVMGHVVQREILKYKPVIFEDESGTAVTIAARAAGNDITIRDPRSSSETLLGGTNMKEKWGTMPHILHGSIGFGPDNFRAYLRHPAKGGNLLGLWPSTTSPSASGGDKLANIDASDSPFHEPSDVAEMVIVPGHDVSIQLFNTRSDGSDFGADSEQPYMNLLFSRYKFEILRPGNVRANVLIRKIMYGDLAGQFRFLPVGFGENLIKFSSTELGIRWGTKNDPLEPISWDSAVSIPDLRRRA